MTMIVASDFRIDPGFQGLALMPLNFAKSYQAPTEFQEMAIYEARCALRWAGLRGPLILDLDVDPNAE